MEREEIHFSHAGKKATILFDLQQLSVEIGGERVTFDTKKEAQAFYDGARCLLRALGIHTLRVAS